MNDVNAAASEPSESLSPRLGSEAVGDRVWVASGVSPGEFATPVQFLDLPKPEDLSMLAELAEEVLNDPLAVQQLSDRVVELLRRDLEQQRERGHGYGRR